MLRFIQKSPNITQVGHEASVKSSFGEIITIARRNLLKNQLSRELVSKAIHPIIVKA